MRYGGGETKTGAKDFWPHQLVRRLRCLFSLLHLVHLSDVPVEKSDMGLPSPGKNQGWIYVEKEDH